jgi:hypothetical protein
MTRKYVFADESGNFDFRPADRARAISRYFILTTITLDDCAIGDALLALRRQLAWEGLPLTAHFHATDERQVVRDRVFTLLAQAEFRIDATIFDKAKVEPRLQGEQFYEEAWYYHLRYAASKIAAETDELLVVGASFGVKRKARDFHNALAGVVRRVSPTPSFRTAFWTAGSDPCLQIADYCCWAIQRKWEDGDSRSYQSIAKNIQSEYDFFHAQEERYY